MVFDLCGVFDFLEWPFFFIKTGIAFPLMHCGRNAGAFWLCPQRGVRISLSLPQQDDIISSDVTAEFCAACALVNVTAVQDTPVIKHSFSQSYVSVIRFFLVMTQFRKGWRT